MSIQYWTWYCFNSVEVPPPSQAEGQQCCCSGSVRQGCNTCGTKKWESARGVSGDKCYPWPEVAQDLGAGEDKTPELHEAVLGGPSSRLFSRISNFVRRECGLLAPSHQQLAGEQQPDTTIEMQPCSFGQIRRKQNAISHEILAWSC